MTDAIGHMERETSVGGEKRGQIKGERGRWRKGQTEREREELLSPFAYMLLIRY